MFLVMGSRFRIFPRVEMKVSVDTVIKFTKTRFVLHNFLRKITKINLITWSTANVGLHRPLGDWDWKLVIGEVREILLLHFGHLIGLDLIISEMVQSKFEKNYQQLGLRRALNWPTITTCHTVVKETQISILNKVDMYYIT